MSFDSNGDPIQGMQSRSTGRGATRITGPVIGIVLSVHYADSEDNMWFQALEGDSAVEDKKRSSYLEANVYVIMGSTGLSLELPNCLITQGKCSKVGPTEDEPAHWSEDIPQGCKASELQEFYAEGGSSGIENLSGDWVVVDFVGGVIQMPIITRWFPNPFNQTNSAGKADGQRWRIRRNNTDLLIDKNGNFSLAHRAGNFLQFNGEDITIKHVKGQTINISEGGEITMITQEGVNLTLDNDGLSFSNGDTAIQVSGEDMSIIAPNGDVNITCDESAFLTNRLSVGATGGQGVCNAQGVTDFAAVTFVFGTLLSVVEALSDAFLPPQKVILEALLSKPVDPSDPTSPTVRDTISGAVLRSARSPSQYYLTKYFSTE